MEWLDKIPQWIKIPLKILLPSLTIFSGVIMFSNERFLKKLYLLQFREDNGFIFGLLFTISISLIIVYVLFFILKKIIKELEIFRTERNYYRLFSNLADIYKKTLIDIYKSPTRSMHLELNDSVTSYLEGIRAIGRSNLSIRYTIFDYYLQPWAEKCIDKFRTNIEKELKKLMRKVNKIKNKT